MKSEPLGLFLAVFALLIVLCFQVILVQETLNERQENRNTTVE